MVARSVLLYHTGKNITLTIDATLQEYGEKLMQYKMGGIVAIEPSSGELLTIVSRNKGMGFCWYCLMIKALPSSIE